MAKQQNTLELKPSEKDLAPTWFFDYESAAVRAFVRAAVAGAGERREQLRRLFAAVRDGIRYDPYALSTDPGQYRASVIATSERAYCVPKAILLVACSRSLGIAARIGFADVRNHLQSERLRAVMG